MPCFVIIGRHAWLKGHYSKFPVMRILFEHKRKSENLYNLYLWPLFLFPLFGILFVSGLQIEAWLKVFFGAILTLASVAIYRTTPFSYDRIVVTEKRLLVYTKRRKQIVPIEGIESYSSGSKLSIKLENGGNIDLSYSYWMMDGKKVREFCEAIKESIERNNRPC